jgi:5-formyltetrahydrofolate cyclo-ligase
MPDQTYGKATARSRFVNNRRALGNRERARQAAAATVQLLADSRLTSADTVAAYWPIGTEPDTRLLIAALVQRGVRVLLPVLRADRDLDWAAYDGDPDALGDGGAGTRRPPGATLGAQEVLQAQVVIVPALGVTDTGVRLGRGGGSYDRVLARIHAAREEGRETPWTCALLYEDELGTLEAGAVEPHDRAVDAAVTASRLVAFSSV